MRSTLRVAVTTMLCCAPDALVRAADDKPWFRPPSGTANAAIDCSTGYLVSLTLTVRDRVVSVGGECMGTGALQPGTGRDRGGGCVSGAKLLRLFRLGGQRAGVDHHVVGPDRARAGQALPLSLAGGWTR